LLCLIAKRLSISPLVAPKVRPESVAALLLGVGGGGEEARVRG